jgi:dipeptidase E
MLERFSDKAKEAMALARAAAARRRCDYLDVEHVLIGLLELPQSNAARLLANLGVDVASLLEALTSLMTPGERSDQGQLPFAPSVKAVLLHAVQDAAARNDNHIGSHHVLMGILRDGDNDAARVLARLGVDVPDLEQAMNKISSAPDDSRLQLLLISNSTMSGGGYLEHCAQELEDFLGERRRVMFVPFALHDHDAYTSKARAALGALGLEVVSMHPYSDKAAALADAQAVFIGGGNTFRLLDALYRHGLVDAIRERVTDGMPYIGSSAGTNVATCSIRTTNDMPIVQPPTFEALDLVPFQINPHYLDPDPNSEHMGETREERILQFHEEHATPVLGLREGCMVRVAGARATLLGRTDARLFRQGVAAEEFSPPADITFLLNDGAGRDSA